MELEEMKSKWMEMSTEIDRQKKLTNDLVVRMTRADYRRKLDKIRVPEMIGTGFAIIELIYIIVNFKALDTWYLLACGIIAILILTIMPVLSLTALAKMRALQVAASDLKELLTGYARARLNFIRVQKASFLLTFLLMVVVMPVMLKIMGGKPVTSYSQWLIFYPVAFIIFYFLANKVFKTYARSAAQAGLVLEGLAEE